MDKEQAANKKFLTPQSISDALHYQEDSVVSRQLIHKSTGNVTLFAFAAGQGLSEHTSPFDALVMIIDGQAEVTVSGIKHQMKTGDILLLPANNPHALQAVEPFKMVLTMIKG
ncbi:MAG: cupin domain-containing protein [Chloroflexota bacterium]|nr:cupin domain-containing protein [Chloroflexota bacterium]